MEFIDHTGHIFSLTDYNENPIGYEYEESKYTFWLNDESTFNLSTDNYYIKPIRILLNGTYDNINIKCDSTIFSLLGSKQIQDALENNGSIFETISINETALTKELTKSDIYEISVPIEFTAGAHLDSKYYYTLPITNSTGIVVDESDEFEYTGEVIYKDDVAYGIVKRFETKYEPVEVKLRVETILGANPNYIMIPFYVVGKSSEQGTFQTNILITLQELNNGVAIYEKYCPITVGGTFVNENEMLVINGKNLGITLPKDIVRAIYQSNFYNASANESLYNEKLKELLLNYMNIKGECGNFNSVFNSLKWFGWGDKITIYKLLQTDNEFVNQYILDNFDITNDVINSFKVFRNSTFVSLFVKENEETDENEVMNFGSKFYGEGKPIMRDLFTETTNVYYDEKDIAFIKPYYDFVMNELGLKLMALKYYFQKYFLPVHLHIHSASISHKVYMNDIKMLTNPQIIYTEHIQLTQDDDVWVTFENLNIHYLCFEKHYIDDSFNEILYNNNGEIVNLTKQWGEGTETVYLIDDISIDMPIYFHTTKELIGTETQYYNVTYVLYKDDGDGNMVLVEECYFGFTQTTKNEYINHIIHPKTLSNLNVMFWENRDFYLYVSVNGKWFTYKFKVKLPDLNIQIGKLQYQYELVNDSAKSTLFNQILEIGSTIKFNSFMYQPDLVNVNNSDFIPDLQRFSNSINKYVTKYTKELNVTGSKRYLNRCHIFDFKTPIPYSASDSKSDISGIKSKIASDNNVSGTLFSSSQNIALYRNFFNNDGSPKTPQLTKINGVEYDLYLMHDYTHWYIMLISKETEDKYTSTQLKIDGNYETTVGGKGVKYVSSSDRFLINRMQFVPVDGVRHFKQDDMLVATLVNYDNIPFKLFLGSKWEFTPMSLGMVTNSKIESNTEMAIVGIGSNNLKYERGYYDVTVKYTIDNFVQHEFTKLAKICIE